MYTISMPISINNKNSKEKTLEQLRRAGASRVFLSFGRVSFDGNKRKKVLNWLKENIEYYKENGLETGVWFWALWRSDIDKANKKMQMITAFEGFSTESNNTAFICPSDKDFIDDTCEFIKQVAELHPDIIMFDDDYRYGNLSTGFGCCCDNHLKIMSQRLGETITRDKIAEKLFCGGENRYRSAWLDVLGESLIDYALNVRKAVDEIDSNIRIAFCSCMSVWDLDGVDSATLAKILAGNTKPLLRLIGAPYWAVGQSWGNRLQNVIELERMEKSWITDENIEVMVEGDVWPRPRYKCPSSYLEGFDTALRSAGIANGILKYMLSYTSSPEYERGYINAHLKNEQIYSDIERVFAGKQDTGVRVYEYMNKIRNADLPNDRFIGKDYIENMFFSRAARLLADNSVPTNYTCKDTVGIAFGENAKYLPESAMDNGLILDIKAAQILKDRGYDVGLERVDGKLDNAPRLFFSEYNEYVESNYQGDSVYQILPKDKAKILITCGEKGNEYPDTYFYENDCGQKFLVFAFDAYSTPTDRYRSYSMQELLFKYIALLGQNVPVKCTGNPDLYVLCKKNETSMAFGLWNFFADRIEQPVIELDREYKSVEFVGCSGTMKGNKLYLSPINAFEFSFISLQL